VIFFNAITCRTWLLCNDADAPVDPCFRQGVLELLPGFGKRQTGRTRRSSGNVGRPEENHAKEKAAGKIHQHRSLRELLVSKFKISRA